MAIKFTSDIRSSSPSLNLCTLTASELLKSEKQIVEATMCVWLAHSSLCEEKSPLDDVAR